MKTLTKVIGIISYLPNNPQERKIREKRLDALLLQLDELWPSVPILIIAQNWGSYSAPIIANQIIMDRHENGLGILGARNRLREKFLELGYEYLIMLDDDISIKLLSPYAAQEYMFAIDSHPDGFMFMRNDMAQLSLCAISRFIYEMEPMTQVNPSKGEGHEDDIWCYTLRVKYPQFRYRFEGIKCEYAGSPSTWWQLNLTDPNQKKTVAAKKALQQKYGGPIEWKQ